MRLTRHSRPFYQAAKIDAASRGRLFRYIQLPKLRGVLTIAILLPLHGTVS